MLYIPYRMDIQDFYHNPPIFWIVSGEPPPEDKPGLFEVVGGLAFWMLMIALFLEYTT